MYKYKYTFTMHPCKRVYLNVSLLFTVTYVEHKQSNVTQGAFETDTTYTCLYVLAFRIPIFLTVFKHRCFVFAHM